MHKQHTCFNLPKDKTTILVILTIEYRLWRFRTPPRVLTAKALRLPFSVYYRGARSRPRVLPVEGTVTPSPCTDCRDVHLPSCNDDSYGMDSSRLSIAKAPAPPLMIWLSSHPSSTFSADEGTWPPRVLTVEINRYFRVMMTR